MGQQQHYEYYTFIQSKQKLQDETGNGFILHVITISHIFHVSGFRNRTEDIIILLIWKHPGQPKII